MLYLHILKELFTKTVKDIISDKVDVKAARQEEDMYITI